MQTNRPSPCSSVTPTLPLGWTLRDGAAGPDAHSTRPETGECQCTVPEVYEWVLESFVEGYWSEHPKLQLRHRLPLERFIRHHHSKRNFGARHGRWARRHDADPVPRAVKDAAEAFSRAIDVYVRRHVETDFTAPLLDATDSLDEACHIAWIAHEMSVLDYLDITGLDFEFGEGDRIFAFCSPAYSWANGFGRQGVMVLRSGHIVDCVLLEAS